MTLPYNNNFTNANYLYSTYQPYNFPQVNTTTSNGTGSVQNTFVWVQGEQAAKSYPVAPGSQVLLFDSENPVFYVKSADSTGKPLPLEIYDFHKRESTEILPDAKVSLDDFATKDDVRTIIKEELAALKSPYRPKNKEVK